MLVDVGYVVGAFIGGCIIGFTTAAFYKADKKADEEFKKDHDWD